MERLLALVIITTVTVIQHSHQDCPGYLKEPNQNPANTSTCVFQFQGQYCDSCCPNNAICCDNGTCLPYDPYCRYPSTCCKQPLCGIRCCSPSHGTPCGQICAPKSTLVCCDANTGMTCSVGKTCCGNNCCNKGSACCNGKCCSPGQVCSSSKQCCNPSQVCNGICCPSGKSCSNSICCPQGSTGCGQSSCCSSNQTCSLSHCCPSGSYWCSGAKKCCPQGLTCLDGTCCASKNICGTSCCATGQTCESNVCTSCPPAHQCGSKCCQDDKVCINGTCQVPCNNTCGTKCCQDGEVCSGGHCCPKGKFWCGTANRCCDASERCSGSGCCHAKQYCLGNCCPTGQYCDPGNICSSCPPSNACGTSCCTKDEVCCGQTCCKQDEACTMNGQCQKICKVPCANGVCCKDTETCCNGQCCPGDRSCCDQKYCCKNCGIWCLYCTRWDICSCMCDAENQPAAASRYTAAKNSPAMPPSEVQKRPQDLPSTATMVINPSSFPCYTSQTLLTDACSIFPCLNNVSNCGNYSYLMEMHKIYCTNIKLYRSQFNSAGQAFLTCASNCITKNHYQAYQQGVIPCCNSMEQWGSGDQQKNCFKPCNFCPVYLSNTFAFTEFFNNTAIVPFELYFQYCNVGID